MASRLIRTADDLDALGWYPVPGHEGVYEITRCGRVRSLPRFVNSPACAGGKRRIKGKEITLQLIRGYWGFQTRLGGGRKRSVMVHRIIALLFVPNAEGKPHVNHIDGDKTNNDPANLEWVTHAENIQHAHRTGLVPPSRIGPGDQGPAAKLDWPTVRTIRAMLTEGHTQKNVASQFGVSQSAIGFIARNETWRVGQ